MSLQSVQEEIAKLTTAEKVQLVDAICDQLIADPNGFLLTEEEKREIDRRLDKHEKNADYVNTWEGL